MAKKKDLLSELQEKLAKLAKLKSVNPVIRLRDVQGS